MVAVSQWLPRVALFLLRMALAEKAKLEWQVPRTGKLYSQPATLIVPLQIHFGRLRESESDDKGRQDLESGGMSLQP